MNDKNIDVTKGVRVTGSFSLTELSFRALPTSEAPNKIILINDNLSFLNASLDGFTLILSRSIAMNPSSFFSATAVVTADVRFEKSSMNGTLKTVQEVEEWIQANKVRIANTFGMPCTVSSAISSVMGQAGLVPFVSAPQIVLPPKTNE